MSIVNTNITSNKINNFMKIHWRFIKRKKKDNGIKDCQHGFSDTSCGTNHISYH